MTATKTITFEVPDQARIAEVHAAVAPLLDEHSILNSVSGSGQVLSLNVTFAEEFEVESLTNRAKIAALHITPCDMTVRG